MSQTDSRAPPDCHRIWSAWRLSAYATFLTKITAHIGREKLLENANRFGIRNDLAIRAILAALQTGKVAGESSAERKTVRLIAMPEENYLRLYLPNTAKFFKHEIGKLEAKIELVMQMLSSFR